MFETTSGDILRHAAKGPITVDAVVSAYMTWINDPAFDPFLPVLWDIRGQSIEISAHDFVRFPQWTNRVTGRRRAGMRSAVLVDNSYAEFVARTITRNSEWAVEFRIFRAEEEALHWLGVGSSAA